MPVTCETASEIFIGAGDVYVDGQPVGATMENNLFRVVREYYTPDLNGVPGPLTGLDYIQSETAELETSIPELSADKLALAVPGAKAGPTDINGTPTSGGGSQALTADAAVGATNVKVAAMTGFTAGDMVQIGTAGNREARRITVVGTVGQGLTLDSPLSQAHATGELVVEIDSTTLAAATVAGATNVKVAAVTGLTVGDLIVIGTAGATESRTITTVGTVGAAGTGIDVTPALTQAHASGESFLKVTSSGATRIESNTGIERRVPSSAYHAWELRVPGLDGREIRFGLRSAIMTENPEFEAADDGTLAPRLTLQARWDPCSPGTSPWYIDRIGATA